MTVREALAWSQVDDWSIEPDDDDNLLVGAPVTEQGTRELLLWLSPLLRHGLPLDAAPELRHAAGMAITHLLVIQGLRVFSRKELATLLAESGLPLTAGIVFELLGQMYWVTREPWETSDNLVIIEPVWSSIASLVGKQAA